MLNISEICFLINATFVVWHIEIWKCGHPVTFYCKERERERMDTLVIQCLVTVTLFRL